MLIYKYLELSVLSFLLHAKFMSQALGPILIILSSLIAQLTLLGLRFSAHSTTESLILLILGNAFCGLAVLLYQLKYKSEYTGTKSAYYFLILWSLCYSFSYAFFSLKPEWISLAGLVIGQSLAPTCAVLLSGDWKKESKKYSLLLWNLLAISLLLVLAYLKSDLNLTGTSEATSLFWTRIFSILFITLLFIGSQLSVRKLSGKFPTLWIQPRWAILNSIFLFAFFIVNQSLNINFEVQLTSFILLTTFISLGILGAQAFMIFGFSKSSPFLGALAMSSSVLIALCIECIKTQTPLTWLEICICLAYVLIFGIKSFIKTRE